MSGVPRWGGEHGVCWGWGIWCTVGGSLQGAGLGAGAWKTGALTSIGCWVRCRGRRGGRRGALLCRGITWTIINIITSCCRYGILSIKYLICWLGIDVLMLSFKVLTLVLASQQLWEFKMITICKIVLSWPSHIVRFSMLFLLDISASGWKFWRRP